MKNILIFGANSMIASGIAELHHNLGHHIVGVYHQKKDLWKDYILQIEWKDLLNSDQKFDLVYMIGSFVPRGKYDQPDSRFYEVNVLPFKELTSKYNSARFIMASSVAVYGLPAETISEFSTVHPDNLYAESKWQGEEYLRQLSSYCIIRLSSIYGKYPITDNFIDRMMAQALKDKKIILFGNGSRKQNYIHLSDAIKILFEAGKSNYNGVLLGTSDESISNLEVAKIISGKTGAEIELTGEDASPSFTFDNRYTKTILNFAVSDVNSGIERILPQ